MKKEQTAIVTLDENTSQVVSTKPPRKKRKSPPIGFTDEGRKKSLAIRQSKSLSNREAAVEIFRKTDCHISKTCRALSITRDTFKGWIADYPEFAQAIEDAKQALIDDAERDIHRASALMDTAATKFILERKGRDRGWGENKQDPAVAIQINWLSEPAK